MKDKSLLYLLGGAALVYFILQSRSQYAAQVALQSNALQAGSAIANANTLANAANALSQDAGNIASVF